MTSNAHGERITVAGAGDSHPPTQPPLGGSSSVKVSKRGVTVDANERLVISGIVSTDLVAASKAIAALPDHNRTMPFRGRSVDEILCILENLDTLLRDMTCEDDIFESSTDNKKAQDLYAQKTKKHIELKVGYFVTDAAIGMRTAFKLLPTALHGNFPDAADNRMRKALYAQGRREEAKSLFHQRIEALTASAQGLSLEDHNIAALNLFATGIVREKEIQKYLDNPSLMKQGYDVIKIKAEPGGLPYWEHSTTRKYNLFRKWEMSIMDTRDNRFTVRFEGDDGLVIKMTYHQKNSVRVKMSDNTVERTGYEYGLGTKCFNVWVLDS